jgi:hypothetical protein
MLRYPSSVTRIQRHISILYVTRKTNSKYYILHLCMFQCIYVVFSIHPSTDRIRPQNWICYVITQSTFVYTQPPIQSVQAALFLGVTRPGREADHSPSSSANVKNVWSYTSIPLIRLHGVVLSKERQTTCLYNVYKAEGKNILPKDGGSTVLRKPYIPYVFLYT